MAGSITPLPVMLEEEEDRKAYAALEPPKSIVVRYGYQKLVAELSYSGDDKPGCGSKMVIRTRRGTELAEMLTTTCPNSGCSKSVSRKDMLDYIENSGGKDFPFTDQGKILRVAEVADLNEQARLDGKKPEVLRLTKQFVKELELEMKPIEAELLLGGERIIIYYNAENWVDFRELVKKLAAELQTRIEMHQVNDREEARLVADYERCGQYCCCKNFLKVLKPVSMRSAKVQKATLDPQKISGRCGRLMCCLRYEDKTYEELRKKLPHRKTLVETEDGIGLVLSSQILTQLVLVKIATSPPAAYPLENIRVLNKEECAEFRKQEQERAEQAEKKAFARRSSSGRSRDEESDKPKEETAPLEEESVIETDDNVETTDDQPKKKRRRRRNRNKKNQDDQNNQGGEGGGYTNDNQASQQPGEQSLQQQDTDSDQSQNGGDGESNGEGKSKRRRRRRRRKRKSGGGEQGQGGNDGGDGGNGGGSDDGAPAEE